jgi:nickel/cobalt transporter (NicO) family protein
MSLRHVVRRLGVLAALAAALVGGSSTPASAHPLGNFTTNTSATIRVRPEVVQVAYVVDLAEIPTLRVTQALGQDDVTSLNGWAQRTCQGIAGKVELRVAGKRRTLTSDGAAAGLSDGQAGLQTLRLSCELSALGKTAVGAAVSLDDQNFADRAGWREIVVPTGAAGAPSVSPTQTLRVYPDAAAPTRQLSVAYKVLAFDAASPGAAERLSTQVDRSQDGLSARFQSLIAADSLAIGFVLTALAIALVLGAGHALAPGHGKSLMAAYVIGRRGGRKDLVMIGSTVAATHTVGVLVLGVLASATTLVSPERSVVGIGVVSGLLVSVVGVRLFRSRMPQRPTGAHHDHDHAHHDHAHHDHDHHHGDHDHGHHDHGDHHHGHDDRWIVTQHAHGGSTHEHRLPKPGTDIRRGELVAMGLAGGMVPSPSALLVLIAAIALDRLWFGLLLVVAYGIGLALTLIGAGLIMSRMESRVRHFVESHATGLVAKSVTVLPLLSAVALIGGGMLLAARSLGAV